MKVWLILTILPFLGLAAVNGDLHQDETHMKTVLADIGREFTSDAQRSLRRRAVSPTSPTHYSQTVITWGAGSKSCAAAATSVLISCASGGKIAIAPGQSGVASCTPVSANTLKCTKQPSASSPYVSVKCTGKYSVTATVPSYKFTNCNKSIRGNNAYQLVNLAQVCAVKGSTNKYTGVYSKSCSPSTDLRPATATSNPYCTYQTYKCVNSTKTTCDMTTNAITISSPTTVDPLCIFG